MKVITALAFALLIIWSAMETSADHLVPPRHEARAAQREVILGGTVLDPEGNPIQGAEITLELVASLADNAHPLFATTDAQGAFTMPHVGMEVRYNLRIVKEGHMPHEEVLMLSRERTVHRLEFTLPLASRTLAREAYERGYEAYRSGRLEEAASSMNEAVLAFGNTEEPDEILISSLVALGQVRLRLGQPEGAEAAFGRALALDPDNVMAHMGMGTVRDQQGKYDHAIARFRHAAELQPENSTALYNLGSLLLTVDEVDGAIEALERCVAAQSDMPQAHRSLGNAYARAGKPAEAIEQLETYLALAPDAPDAEQVRELIASLK